MKARRRPTKGAPTSIAGAFLLCVVILSGTFAAADAPWPQRSPGQEPEGYEQYCFSLQPPNDYITADGDLWKYSGEKSNSLYQVLIGLFNPGLSRRELEGVMGASVDKAWSVTTGRPDVLIAALDTGIKWHDASAMSELRRKLHLNGGELPPPLGAEGWDGNRDGVFNVDDYAGDPRVADLNGNGILDPEDLIWYFSDGDDDDGNGYVDDICGWDFLEDDNDPWDELDHGHGTAACVWSAGEANNGSGIPGTCPNAMLLPVRVGDSYVADVNDFAQGVVFAVDSGAWVVQEALSGINNTPLAQAAIDYAYARGVAVIACAGRDESARQEYPSAYEHTIQVNAVQKYVAAGSESGEQFPPSYLYLGGNSAYGAHNLVSVPSDGHSSGAAGRLAGIAALIYSAAENDVRRGELWRYPGLDTPLSACEVKQIIAMTAQDIDFSPGSYGVSFGALDAVIGPSRRFPSSPGWDPYFGYGRVNAYEAVMAVDQGRIPPEAEITSPRWFEPLDPGQVFLQVEGRVAAVRADSFQYTVEWAPGWDPAEDEWITAGGEDSLYQPVNGVLATLDLGMVYNSLADTVQARGGAGDPNRYTFSVRVRVRDNRGNWGEDRKAAFCFHDPDAYAGTPVSIGSSVSAPRFADLDDDGESELIVATGGGEVHAFNPDLSEVAGWPVHATPLPLHADSEGFKSGAVPSEAYASVTAAPAVGDLDRDGTLEVVAADMQGRVYAWDKAGGLLPGFPLLSNPLYSIPDRCEWQTEGALPEAWYASRLVPDRAHRLDKWNCLDRGFMAGPVLSNLDASPDGSLEIIAACMDQHVYAWHADGKPVEGWPVKLVDAAKVTGFDSLTHTCTFNQQESVPRGSKIVAAPCVADLEGDGDLEVVCVSNELYRDEPVHASARTFGLSAFLSLLKPYAGAAAETLIPGNTRAYALHHDGAAHGLAPGESPAPDAVPVQAYLAGWPVKVAVAVPGMLPVLLEGTGSPAAAADLDGDGRVEVGISPAVGPGYLLEPDGSSFMGNDEDGMPLGPDCNQAGSTAGSADFPLAFAWGGGTFADLGTGSLAFVAPTMGLGRLADMFLPADQVRSDDQLSAWSTADGGMLARFPVQVDGAMLSVTPAAADVDGDGLQEVLAGSSGYDFHAADAGGEEAVGWPKFTAGRSSAAPAVGDFDGDGGRELAVGTHEGWLFVWETASSSGDAAGWAEYGHDPWGTGCLETDAWRPGRVADLAAEALAGEGGKARGVKLTWTAPGDDGLWGKALCYEIRFLDRPIDGSNWREAVPLERGKPLPGEPGTQQEYLFEGFPFDGSLEGKVVYFALQTRDEAGNLSAVSTPASLSYPARSIP